MRSRLTDRFSEGRDGQAAINGLCGQFAACGQSEPKRPTCNDCLQAVDAGKVSDPSGGGILDKVAMAKRNSPLKRIGQGLAALATLYRDWFNLRFWDGP